MAKNEKKIRRAVIYARYSSHAQNDASIEQQVEKCTAYAQKNGIEILRVYADRAMTGKNDKRPDFQKMLKDAEKGEFDGVIAWKSNRMGRNMMEAMINDARLLECGVRTRYVEEDFDDSAAGRFSLRNMMNLNQFYSENMAEDIMRGMTDAAKNRRAMGYFPLGYKKDPDTKTFIIDETTAPIVREIFERVAKGETLAVIADEMNARGVKTMSGGKWNKGSFHRLLSNSKYTGLYKWADIEIPDGIPAIVSKEMFDKVQEIINNRSEVAGRRRRSNVDYLLTGKLFCGHCDEPMTGMSGKGRHGGMFYYYACRGQRVHKSCHKKPVKKDVIEKAVARALMDNVLSQQEILEKMADTVMEYQQRLKEQSQVEYYNTKLGECRKGIANLTKALETGLISEAVTARMKELEAEAAEYAVLIADYQRRLPNYTRDMVLYYLEQFRKGNIEDKRFLKKMFSQFIDKIYLYDDRLTITFGYTGDEGLDVPMPDEDIEIELGSDGVCLSSPNVHFRCQRRTLFFTGERFELTVPFEG